MPIDYLSKENCCGCNACGDVCPTKAISFETDNEGFWYPKVNQDICINCELCTKICPEINAEKLKINDFKHPLCYAAENKNLDVVFDSTSGGVFSAFADKFYREGGYVGGAVYSEDCMTVKQYISADKKDLPRLRSSKYLQSDLSGFYNEVQRLVKHGEKVVVCGCPCQMAALRSFLRKDYPNLLILDFVCLGINSPKIHRAYIQSFEERYHSPVVAFKAKSKEYGWRNLTYKATLKNGQAVYETKNNNLFIKGYIGTGLYMRPSCYECKFRGFPRISDVTLADFWGIEKHDNSFDKDLGISLVLLNSIKGKEWFGKIKGRLNVVKLPFQSALEGNPALLESRSLNPTIKRDEFFKDVYKLSFGELADKYGFSFKPDPKRKTIKSILRSSYHALGTTIKFAKDLLKHPYAGFQTLRNNPCSKWLSDNRIHFSPYSIAEIAQSAKIDIKAPFVLGSGRWRKTRLETHLLLGNLSTLIVNGKFICGYGSDIQVHDGGKLVINGLSATNIGFNLICSNYIEIGKDVMIGRHVTIRDNNGGHYINRAGYKDKAPVIIHDKAWLCEGCTIMPGVTIGQGAIVAAHSVVTHTVKPFTMVAGNPARVIEEDILWKY